MSSFSQGKYALAISDRSGLAFPYNEMVREWNGALVHVSEFEPKQPQLQPKPTNADPQALQRARPARTEFPTEDFLPENPLVTASNTTLKINFPNGDLQVNDQIRLRNIKSPVGGVALSTLQLSTTLNGDITATADSIVLTDGSQFPTSGFIVIEKVNTDGSFVNETIEYTGRSSNTLTGCVRGTSAPYRGVTFENTTAGTHANGAKVFGSYKVVSLNTTQVLGTGQPQYSTQFDGLNVTLITAASSTETGGGFQCTIGPVNDRA
tara:strand:+ start:998 stop:1792 length:795 start_codon:yes stop_codon:yes gene_type:complete